MLQSVAQGKYQVWWHRNTKNPNTSHPIGIYIKIYIKYTFEIYVWAQLTKKFQIHGTRCQVFSLFSKIKHQQKFRSENEISQGTNLSVSRFPEIALFLLYTFSLVYRVNLELDWYSSMKFIKGILATTLQLLTLNNTTYFEMKNTFRLTIRSHHDILGRLNDNSGIYNILLASTTRFCLCKSNSS